MTNPVRAQLVLRREPVPRSRRRAQSGCGSVGEAGQGLAPHGGRTGRSRQDSAASPRPVPAHRRRDPLSAASSRRTTSPLPRHLPGPVRAPRPPRCAAPPVRGAPLRPALCPRLPAAGAGGGGAGKQRACAVPGAGPSPPRYTTGRRHSRVSQVPQPAPPVRPPPRIAADPRHCPRPAALMPCHRRAAGPRGQR